ncbi:MAG: hypothetical protein Tp1111DCM1126091_136 [Prokaryotic dsDNA virus sp.]|nr:MAG: hypothetical protein Tp1111DCM1126091_136 [Prokaryotic dsDNA virus sp.]|tara:strand:+ start:15462 stop:15755 length:294 start_codon:yes stop_codon:yes gene_type:complete
MPKDYLIDREPYINDYYEIYDKICIAQTDTEFRVIQQMINDFHRKHRYKFKGFWWLTWAIENKAAHSAWNSLQALLLFRMNEVYDSSGKFGKTGESK